MGSSDRSSDALLQIDEQIGILRLDGDIKRGVVGSSAMTSAGFIITHRDHTRWRMPPTADAVLFCPRFGVRNAVERQHLDGALPRVSPAHTRVHPRDFTT